MTSLVLGPLVRHVGERDATIWVETDAACTVAVCGCETRTFRVGGHHYALVIVEGLEAEAATPYEVHLDGEKVWPLDDDWPHSVIRTTSREKPIDIVFGSCRTAYPHEPPYTLPKDEHEHGREVCALRAMAMRLREQPVDAWPGALLHLGDQIYADEVDPDTAKLIQGEEIGGFEDYTLAYKVSWSDPAIRWLFSTVPCAMIFDDHDVIDDWNTSAEWLEEIRKQPWWNERIIGAFVSYWVYQHIGNLSPRGLAEDEVWSRVHGVDDAEPLLREFAYRADREVDSTRWSFCRNLGSAKLIMIDSRAGRILQPDRREMVDDDEWAFIERNAIESDCQHVLLGTSLPWLLAPGMHHLEAWNEAISEGAWRAPGRKVGEKMRQGLDLEHWGAFGNSWKKLTQLIGRVGSGEGGYEPPATIIALSGDVHHAYLAKVRYPEADRVRSRVYQAVASPFRNPLDTRERRVIKAAASRPAAVVTRALARLAGVEKPAIRWKLNNTPVFDNVVATLHLDGRNASVRLERARPIDEGRGVSLECVRETTL